MKIIMVACKVLILVILVRFFKIVRENRKLDATLKSSFDFISISEVGITLAVTMACLLSSLKQESSFICIISLLDALMLYYEGKRIILIGEKTIQIREKCIKIEDIIDIKTYFALLIVSTKEQAFKVMNPLVMGWKFQEKVYSKVKGGNKK